MTNNNQVNWGNITEEVEAVIIQNGKVNQHLKTVEGVLYFKVVRLMDFYCRSKYKSVDDREENISDISGAIIIRRPNINTIKIDWVDSGAQFVVLYPDNHHAFYKFIDGDLHVQFYRGCKYRRSSFNNISEILEDYDGDRVLMRPSTEEIL